MLTHDLIPLRFTQDWLKLIQKIILYTHKLTTVVTHNNIKKLQLHAYLWLHNTRHHLGNKKLHSPQIVYYDVAKSNIIFQYLSVANITNDWSLRILFRWKPWNDTELSESILSDNFLKNSLSSGWITLVVPGGIFIISTVCWSSSWKTEVSLCPGQ
jgi:hypothetical protein